MLAKVCSAAVSGIEAYPVEVEVNAGYGDAILVIVGRPNIAFQKSHNRENGTGGGAHGRQDGRR